MLTRALWGIPFLGVMAAVLGSGAAGRAETAPPPLSTVVPAPASSPSATATTVPTPSDLPAPGALLAGMQRAFTRAGLVHVVSVTTSRSAGVMHGREVSIGDLSVRSHTLHQVTKSRKTDLTHNPPRTTSSREEQIMVGAGLAVREGRAAWQCASLRGMTTDMGTLLPSYARSDQAEVTDTTVGAERLHGRAVWHVRLVVVLDGLISADRPATIDLWLTQSELLPLREVQTVPFSLDGLTPNDDGSSVGLLDSVQEDFSQYGEHVTIALPQACASAIR